MNWEKIVMYGMWVLLAIFVNIFILQHPSTKIIPSDMLIPYILVFNAPIIGILLSTFVYFRHRNI